MLSNEGYMDRFKIIIHKESKEILSTINLITLKKELDVLLSDKSYTELNTQFPNSKELHKVITRLQKKVKK